VAFILREYGPQMTSRKTLLLAAAALAAAGLTVPTVSATAAPPDRPQTDRVQSVRFSTFNASLNGVAAGEVRDRLAGGTDPQMRNVAEVIQRAAPDVLLVNEFDYEPDGESAELFRDNYLEKSWNGSTPADYPYYFVAPSNTGVPTGLDLNNNGVVGAPGTQAGGDDSFGFGLFPGQYGMVVYSKFPILTDQVRTFQHFLWKDMPDSLLPTDFYSAEEQAIFRLSSKSHWDVPVKLPGRKPVHFLVSHPTPPTFDGTEDRNGRRNHDEIRFWADYVTGGSAAAYIYDDAGQHGGLGKGQDFVIAGDQNADPYDGDSTEDAIWQLLDHPRVNAKSAPESDGATEAALLQGGANLSHTGPHAQDTADFNDNPAPGNLRADYVLPSADLDILDSAVFWPLQADPLFRLTGVFTPSLAPIYFPTSDHRLVWVDVAVER
jgi:hypothetical protein